MNMHLRSLQRNIDRLAGELASQQLSTPLQIEPPSSSNKALADPYNTYAADILESVLPLVRARRQEITSFFYGHLRDEREKILQLLTPKESVSLTEMQMRYLELLFSPALSAPQHYEMALRAGERHDAVSLPPKELAESYQDYRRAIYAHLPELRQSHQLAMQVVEQRLNNDLAWQMMGVMQAMQQRNHHLKKMSDALHTFINHDDLLDFVLNGLRELPGIVGAGIARFATENQLICKKATGLVLHRDACTPDDSRPFRDQPLLQAWREERPVWINSVTHEIKDEGIREAARQLGIRSYAIIPITDIKQAPVLLLVVYSNWPGFFLAQDKHFFFENLARNLSPQFKHMEASRQRHLAELSVQQRQHYRKLLEDGKVEIVYQPIIDPLEHRVVKLEALARLVDENGQKLSPHHFLGAFGSSQLLTLFEQGLKQACETLAAIHKTQGEMIGISINFPTEAFEYPQFIHRIHSIVQSHGLPPNLITLEILESGKLDENKTIEAIHALKKIGFSIAMDDVGSGESSLLRMKSLPLDEIKIDQGFIHPLLNNLDHLDYVDTLIRLATNLNISCVVEGVENQEINDMIGALGFSYLQGYSIHKPMTRSEVLDWVGQFNAQKGNVYFYSVKDYQVQILYTWYARHLKRARLIIEALPNNNDLLNFDIVTHWESCPMTHALETLGMKDHPLFEAHRIFHDTVTDLRTRMIEGQNTTALKQQLNQIVQRIRQLVQEHTANIKH
ncbi:EAL domain-containing protein [Candidatus Igneacidithiobacillus taiwanensis]|uniref:EAL domain-containing protein n=1 Tax=Candidatus Igneacidithiobacillus taiwanensis TaxID=1945924 RepID=UPI00289D022D|nr:EAL domain-containing protein [Candidatus Igneacidithiobacillus taiwanensis]